MNICDQRLKRQESPTSIGLLLSGGLDSCILLHHLLEGGCRVQPFYVDCGFQWQQSELSGLRRYLSAASHFRMDPMVILQMPLSDVFHAHWCITGRNVPSSESSAEAVFLPGRNLLLAMKAACWCQMHGISDLALATLNSNPFPDATVQFFNQLESVVSMALSAKFRILRPFAYLEKRQVMELGKELPLHLTFSCIAPIRGQHCGECNKCFERQLAFSSAGREDLSDYVHSAEPSVPSRIALRQASFRSIDRKSEESEVCTDDP